MAPRAQLHVAIAFTLAIPASAFCQTPDHAAQVRVAQRAAYAITSATNGCWFVTIDLHGWPSTLVRRCIYVQGAKPHQMTGVAYVVDVRPEVIARWVESSCETLLPGLNSCFETVLRCGKLNSGMMFPASGNIIENGNNYFFRNGMTVVLGGQPNGTSTPIALDYQDELALMPNSAITSVPSGLTRFWRTRPQQFAARYPESGAPADLHSAAAVRRWLDLARSEFMSALERPDNRLLDAWVAAHTVTLRKAACPSDIDP